jgi:hypothetical protein
MQYGVTFSLNKITQNTTFHFCTLNGPSVGTASDRGYSGDSGGMARHLWQVLRISTDHSYNKTKEMH